MPSGQGRVESSQARAQPPSVAPQVHAGKRSSSTSSITSRPAQSSSSITIRRPAANTYTDEELELLERQQQMRKTISRKNLEFALDHVVQVLEKSHIPYGITGDMSMLLFGYQGRTTVVEVTVESSVATLLAAFSTDDRATIPRRTAVAAAGSARIFILTGRDYQENVEDMTVKVVLKLSVDSKGAPRKLAGSTSTHTLTTDIGPRTWSIVDFQHLFRARLLSFHNGKLEAYTSLVWMCLYQNEAAKKCAATLQQSADLQPALEHFARYAERMPSAQRVTRVYELLGLVKTTPKKPTPTR